MKYRVWWIPQVGADIPTFYRVVNTFKEAKILYDTLAEYDLYQLENNIKPDYSNAGGIQIPCEMQQDGTYWEDWYIETDFGYFDDPDEYEAALRDYNGTK